MKKCIFLLIAALLLSTLLLPFSAYADTYEVSETDLTISIDDSEWYVFTRDNLKDNPELEELGVSYEETSESMRNNNIYLEALLFKGNSLYIDLVVTKDKNDVIVNLSNYDDDKVLTMIKESSDQYEINIQEYQIYETDYKFVKIDATEKDFYICRYATIINGYDYLFTFTTEDQFTDFEYEITERIMNSVEFDVDTSLKEKNQSSGIFSGVLGGAIKGGLIGAIVGGLISLFSKKKKKNTDENAEQNGTSAHPFEAKKDHSSIKCGIGITLLVLQGIILLCGVISGRIGELLDKNVPFWIGFFSPAIIGASLLAIGNKEKQEQNEKNGIEPFC